MFSWATIPAFPLFLSFVLGIISYGNHPMKVNAFHIAAFFILLIFSFTVQKKKILHSSIPAWRTSLLLLGTFIFGYVWSGELDDRNKDTFFEHHQDKATNIVVVVQEGLIEKTKTYLLPTRIIGFDEANQQFHKATGKANIYFYQQDSIPDIKVGDTIVLPNKLVKIKHSNNPYAFNYAQYAAHQQLYLQGFYAFKDISYKSNHASTTSWINNLRQASIQTLRNNIGDTTTLSISLAMLMNERALLHDNIWKSYAATGIIHIISISGMHIQIFLMLIIFSLSWIKNNKYKWIKYALAAIIVWVYISLTLNPPSAVRAGFMFSITALALRLNKQEQPINSLFATALIMLCMQPYWLYNLGFQLSFLCMLSIYLFYKPIKNLVFIPNKWLRYLWEGLAMSIAVQILVAPLVIYYFHQFPLFVFLVNIPAAIYSTVMMVGNIAIILFGNILPMHWLGNLLAFITTVFNHLVAFFADYTPKSLSQYAFDKLDTLLFTLFLACSAYYLLFAKKKKVLMLNGVLLILFMTNVIVQNTQSKDQERLVVYQANGQSAIQVVKGKSQHVFITDSSAIEKYLKFPTLHWNINQSMNALPFMAKFNIGPYSAAAINQETVEASQIDIIILQAKFVPDIKEILYNFNPKLVILDSSFPRWKAKKYLNENSDTPIPIYSVTLNGAFVYPTL